MKIIIDTDPGQDDAVALLLAFGSPELEVLGVTCVAGNVPLALTLKNARKICELAGRADVPVFAGADKPLACDLVTAEEVHGETGLDGVDLPEPKMPVQDEHAADFIVRMVKAEPAGSVTLCPLGPLTNIALALRKAPEIAERLAGIVLMGGGYFIQGNVTPSAEFNIYVDPEAADEVMKSGAKVTFMPLDCTHQALTSRARMERIAKAGPVGAAVAQLNAYYERFDVEKYGTDGAPLHDPCVIAYLLRPELFTGKFVNVEIETKSPLTRGATVADWWGATDRKPNATFIRDIDAEGFFTLLAERLASLPAARS